jgi:hypothetical protein
VLSILVVWIAEKLDALPIYLQITAPIVWATEYFYTLPDSILKFLDSLNYWILLLILILFFPIERITFGGSSEGESWWDVLLTVPVVWIADKVYALNFFRSAYLFTIIFVLYLKEDPYFKEDSRWFQTKWWLIPISFPIVPAAEAIPGLPEFFLTSYFIYYWIVIIIIVVLKI